MANGAGGFPMPAGQFEKLAALRDLSGVFPSIGL
jgi:hypothetical protein